MWKGALLLLSATLTLGSCSNLAYLAEDQSLYTGSSVKIESSDKITGLREIESAAESVIRPAPNSRFLIWRPRLWIYNVAGGEGRISTWLRNRVGRPPVLFEQVDPDRTVRLIQNRLFNMGYFDAAVDFMLREKPKRTAVVYQIEINRPFTIRDITFSNDGSDIANDIERAMDESLLEKGQVYSLDMLKRERDRIDGYLKERGYFYFHADYLLFRADSTIGNRMTDLFLTVKPATPPEALEKYRIRNIVINTGQPASVGTGDIEADGVSRGGLIIRQGETAINPVTLERAVFLSRDSLYSYNNHRLTISHLMGLGIFKFVNIRFERTQNTGDNSIDAMIMLTPMEKKSLSSEVSWVTKSNSFTGPGLTGSFSNRNLLGGAENFSVNLEGAYESLFGQKGVTSTEAGITSEVSIPRLLTPFSFSGYSYRFIPKTNISVSFHHRNRTDAFSLSSLRSQFGYQWSPSSSIRHRLNPLVFNIFSLGSVSPEYESIFSQEELLRRGMFEQFLLGADYSFLYNSQLAGQSSSDWYFNFNVDLSGNFAWLMSNYIFNAGSGFSQYAKADFDLRYYLDTGSRGRIATRFSAGVGQPYGNSETLPYTRHFTIGGSNSIRAFQPRTLGPGSYSSPDTLTSTLNIYQSGEVKFEMSIEYRLDLGNIFKAAVFADAGNIWNLREKDNVPGGMFKRDRFIRQIALGTGAGLRMDFTFFLLRLDLAFPLANPANEASYFERIRPLDPDWRRNNLVLNLAIGYPF